MKNKEKKKRTIKDITIGRDEFARKLAKKLGCSIPEGKRVLECFIDTSIETLLEHGGYRFLGFGTLWVDQREAKIGRNPKTGEVIPIPPRNFVKFDPMPELKKLVQ